MNKKKKQTDYGWFWFFTNFDLITIGDKPEDAHAIPELSYFVEHINARYFSEEEYDMCYLKDLKIFGNEIYTKETHIH